MVSVLPELVSPGPPLTTPGKLSLLTPRVCVHPTRGLGWASQAPMA